MTQVTNDMGHGYIRHRRVPLRNTLHRYRIMPVARMERSEIRGPSRTARQSRIPLRSMQATGMAGSAR
jgi:hypothetical protein